MPRKILIVDDEPFNLDLLEQELADLGYAAQRAEDGEQALKRLNDTDPDPDLVLLDYQMPGLNGIEVLRKIRQQKKDLPVVIITAHGSIERAVEAIKAGADDFVTKPFDPEHLAVVLNKCLERAQLKSEVELLVQERVQLKSEVELLVQELGEHHRMVIGDSAATRQIVEEAKKAAAGRSTTVLLLGERGTGKELFARSIHEWSERRLKPFVAINCPGLGKELLESELFGHEKGAFTSADRLKKGKLELAHGGTVFLDEIGDLALELQTKLLRFLAEREFQRVGNTASISVDVRIIAATNRDIEAAVKAGSFREDLYDRLNVIALMLPPLRGRREEIPVLANHFLRKFSSEAKKNFQSIAEEAAEKLLAYDWPGNVRELANVIERAVVLGEGPQLAVHHLPARLLGAQPVVSAGRGGGNNAANGAPANALRYHEAINAFRRELIERALANVQGNRAAAAKALGLHRNHLLKLMKAMNIS